MVEPIVVNLRTGNIVGGHSRFYVLQDLGRETAEVSIVDLDEHREKLLNVALNRITGAWNYNKLEELLSEFDMSEILFTGFNEGEINTLFDNEDIPELDTDTSQTTQVPPDGSEEAGERFTLYLSFTTRSEAENWLRDNGYSDDVAFIKSRNITVIAREP